MKTIIILLLSVLLYSQLVAQTFQIGRTTIDLIDSSRSNRIISTEIYYPADVAGNNVPLTLATNSKFPAISFGHGFVMTWDAYQNIWDALVPDGFIIAFPKTEGGIAPSHTEFGKDIAFVLSELSVIGQNTSSLFYNRVDTMNCVMGHSMGGGAAFIASQLSSTVKSLATLAPAETNPSAIQAAASVYIPSLILAGVNDCVTPPVTNQIPMFDSLQSNCKTLVSIDGGSHCQMADNNLLCNFGEATCLPQPTITRAEQHLLIKRYLLPWLKYQLKRDCFAGAQFDLQITTDTGISVQKNCLLCNATVVDENPAMFKIDLFPNPFNDNMFIECTQSENSKVIIELYLMSGSKIFSQTFDNVQPAERLKLNLGEDLLAGIYLLKVTVNGRHSFRKLIKQ